jgi:putative membrane protein
VATGSAADSFLGAQGDPWDTQEDMATAAVGALTALLLFPKLHDRLIVRLEAKNQRSLHKNLGI